ncbi:MAG: AbrB family transcriptional regulator [Mailhella sp.]|nr:AbrB family transcriptional regulator [Mailhella sp.]
MMPIVLLVVSGAAAGYLFHYLNIPGGCMLGAVAGAIAVKVFLAAEITVAPAVYNVIQIGMGICVGAMFSTELLPVIRAQLPVMLLSTAILLAAGLAAAFFVRHTTDMDVISSILSTSPGGLNAVIGMAENNEHMPKIMAFQMTRLYMVIFMVPVFCWFMKCFFHK